MSDKNKIWVWVMVAGAVFMSQICSAWEWPIPVIIEPEEPIDSDNPSPWGPDPCADAYFEENELIARVDEVGQAADGLWVEVGLYKNAQGYEEVSDQPRSEAMRTYRLTPDEAIAMVGYVYFDPVDWQQQEDQDECGVAPPRPPYIEEYDLLSYEYGGSYAPYRKQVHAGGGTLGGSYTARGSNVVKFNLSGYRCYPTWPGAVRDGQWETIYLSHFANLDELEFFVVTHDGLGCDWYRPKGYISTENIKEDIGELYSEMVEFNEEMDFGEMESGLWRKWPYLGSTWWMDLGYVTSQRTGLWSFDYWKYGYVEALGHVMWFIAEDQLWLWIASTGEYLSHDPENPEYFVRYGAEGSRFISIREM